MYVCDESPAGTMGSVLSHSGVGRDVGCFVSVL